MLPVLLAFILTVIHFFSKGISKRIEKHHIRIMSFSAGMLVTLIFVDLIPRVIVGINITPVYVFLLFGFVLFHLSEKYIYQHIKNRKVLMKDLAELHTLGFFLDHLMIGIILAFTFTLSTHIDFIIFIPFLLHTISSSISLEHITEKTKLKVNRFILSNSTLIGAIFATLLKPSEFWYYSIFAFLLGALLYISIRDMLPKGKKGDSMLFILGFMLTLILVLLARIY